MKAEIPEMEERGSRDGSALVRSQLNSMAVEVEVISGCRCCCRERICSDLPVYRGFMYSGMALGLPRPFRRDPQLDH